METFRDSYGRKATRRFMGTGSAKLFREQFHRCHDLTGWAVFRRNDCAEAGPGVYGFRLEMGNFYTRYPDGRVARHKRVDETWILEGFTGPEAVAFHSKRRRQVKDHLSMELIDVGGDVVGEFARLPPERVHLPPPPGLITEREYVVAQLLGTG